MVVVAVEGAGTRRLVDSGPAAPNKTLSSRPKSRLEPTQGNVVGVQVTRLTCEHARRRGGRKCRTGRPLRPTERRLPLLEKRLDDSLHFTRRHNRTPSIFCDMDTPKSGPPGQQVYLTRLSCPMKRSLRKTTGRPWGDDPVHHARLTLCLLFYIHRLLPAMLGVCPAGPWTWAWVWANA